VQADIGVASVFASAERGAVLLIAGSNDLLLWRWGDCRRDVRFSPHGWSDFCPLKERRYVSCREQRKGFSMVEVLLAMMLLVTIVTALSGYHRALAARFTMFNQYRQLWHHAWNQSQLSTNVLPAGWQASRVQTTQSGCVSITVTLISPLGRRGEMTRLHCPVSQ
jgi:prepilin peptidase dependent protein C